MLRRLITNHVLANLFILLVLVAGFTAYFKLPREQDPEVNFNWVQIVTTLPGASAEDVEREVTSPLEEGLRKVADIKFVSSASRDSISSILVRFNDLDEAAYQRRVTDLRREVLSRYNAELPRGARDPVIFEVNSGNLFPTAMLVLTGQADDDLLRKAADILKKDLERLSGVDQVEALGLTKPELQVRFDPQHMQAYQVAPTQLADSVAAHFRDTAAGTTGLGDQEWLVRLKARTHDPEALAKLPLMQTPGFVRVGDVAGVFTSHDRKDQLVRFEGRPAVMFNILKKPHTHSLKLIETINQLIAERNAALQTQGMRLALVDDQTVRIKSALQMMEENALYGLILMLFVTWLFLGWRLALLNALAIPFALAGLFWYLSLAGQTLNTAVLIGVLIALGMVVDGSVVVIDSIYYRLQHGATTGKAALNGLKEVMVPVLVSVLIAIAAFLPLILMPGILGKFMMVIPIVVTVALLVSLIDAFWLLPGHVVEFRINFREPSKVHAYRIKAGNWLINKYYKTLLVMLKRPLLSAAVSIVLFVGAGLMVYFEQVRVEFFADDPIRLFYVNVEMPPSTRLEETMRVTVNVEQAVRKQLRPNEARSVVSYAGYYMTDKDPQIANHLGQVMVSLNPEADNSRSVYEVQEAMRAVLSGVPGPVRTSFLSRSSGPPLSKPIEIKVRGDHYETLRAAADEMRSYIASIPGAREITDDDSLGKMELRFAINQEAAQRARLDPLSINRIVQLYFDGEIVGEMHHEGEKLQVRVRAQEEQVSDIDAILKRPVALPRGGHIALGDLVSVEKGAGKGNIRHYNFRRTITLQGELDKTRLDAVKVNKLAQAKWREIAPRYPGVALDFSGELDDIKEAQDALGLLMLVGVGIIYVILGAQFKSYVQPLIIFAAVPLAFTGVVFGLYLTGNPISLYTMYGMVALTGVIISTAIVLIDAANTRREAGLDPLKATLYAATRRLLPIILTSATTFVDLVPLAQGWGGKSLIWSPLATAIVYGLLVSTVLTLFIIPLLYFIIELTKPRQRRTSRKKDQIPDKAAV